MLIQEPSAWNKYPSDEDPYSRYKFTSIEINFSPDREYVTRQTYGILDWFGDLGGLLDILYLLGAVLIYPVENFNLHSLLLSKMFRFRSSDKEML